MHEAQVMGICFGLISIVQLPYPLKQSVYNGSVPFEYSLNSSFDTGNDSWLSSGAWQVGPPVQKMLAGTDALWERESRGPRSLGTTS